MPLLEFLRTSHESMTASEIWNQITVLRANGVPRPELPPSDSECRRSLRLLKMQGYVKETVVAGGESVWEVVYRTAEKVAQKALW